MGIPDFRPGPLRQGQLNALVKLANAVAAMDLSGGLAGVIDSAGIAISAPECGGFWIEVTGHISTNLYNWKLKYHDSGTTFIDGPDDDDSGADPAYEFHQFATVTNGTIWWAWRDRLSGKVMFEADQCPA